jgi:hypothetical protein
VQDFSSFLFSLSFFVCFLISLLSKTTKPDVPCFPPKLPQEPVFEGEKLFESFCFVFGLKSVLFEIESGRIVFFVVCALTCCFRRKKNQEIRNFATGFCTRL